MITTWLPWFSAGYLVVSGNCIYCLKHQILDKLCLLDNHHDDFGNFGLTGTTFQDNHPGESSLDLINQATMDKRDADSSATRCVQMRQEGVKGTVMQSFTSVKKLARSRTRNTCSIRNTDSMGLSTRPPTHAFQKLHMCFLVIPICQTSHGYKKHRTCNTFLPPSCWHGLERLWRQEKCHLHCGWPGTGVLFQGCMGSVLERNGWQTRLCLHTPCPLSRLKANIVQFSSKVWGPNTGTSDRSSCECFPCRRLWQNPQSLHMQSWIRFIRYWYPTPSWRARRRVQLLRILVCWDLLPWSSILNGLLRGPREVSPGASALLVPFSCSSRSPHPKHTPHCLLDRFSILFCITINVSQWWMVLENFSAWGINLRYLLIRTIWATVGNVVTMYYHNNNPACLWSAEITLDERTRSESPVFFVLLQFFLLLLNLYRGPKKTQNE